MPIARVHLSFVLGQSKAGIEASEQSNAARIDETKHCNEMPMYGGNELDS